MPADLSEKRVSIIGVGRMGAPMSRRLLEAGYKLTVCDPNKAAVDSLVQEGAQAAATPAEAATQGDVILLSLPTPDVVEAVAFGKDGLTSSADLGPSRIVVDLSTTGPEGAEALARGVTEKGAAVVDCPVSGGVGGAEKGTLALMASGPQDAFDQVASILAVLGKAFLVGPKPGMGQMTKVINNLLSVTALAITSEALVLGKKAGLDPEVMVDVFNSSSGQSNASSTKIPKFVLSRSFDFGFALSLSTKDARLCLEQSETLGVPMVVGSAVREMLKIAKAKNGPDADLTTLIQPIEDWAGVTVEGSQKHDK